MFGSDGTFLEWNRDNLVFESELMLCCFTDPDVRSRFRIDEIEMLLNDLCSPNHCLVLYILVRTHTINLFRFSFCSFRSSGRPTTSYIKQLEALIVYLVCTIG